LIDNLLRIVYLLHLWSSEADRLLLKLVSHEATEQIIDNALSSYDTGHVSYFTRDAVNSV